MKKSRYITMALVAAMMAAGTPAVGGTFINLPAASVPLGNIPDAVPLDQGPNCSSSAPQNCVTSEASSLRIGQPIQTNCAAITSPFPYQQCVDTSVTPNVLRWYIGSSWQPVATLVPGGGFQINTLSSPFTLTGTSVTTTGTQLDYLNAATGTTGDPTTNLVFSSGPTISDEIVNSLTGPTGSPLSLSAPSSQPLQFGANGTAGTLLYNGTTLYPSATTAVDLGSSSFGFGMVFSDFLESPGNDNLIILSNEEIQFGPGGGGSVMAVFGGSPPSFSPLTAAVAQLGTTSKPFSAAYANTLSSGSGYAMVLQSPSGEPIEFAPAGSTLLELTTGGVLEPYSAGAVALGTSLLPFSTLYTGSVISGTGGSLVLGAPAGQAVDFAANGGATSMTFNGSALSPASNGGIALGTSSAAYSAVYAGTVYASSAVYSNEVISNTGTALVLAAPSSQIIEFAANGAAASLLFNGTTFYPQTTNDVTLGSSSLEFSAIYISQIYANTGSNLNFGAQGNSASMALTASAFEPTNSGGLTLGSSALKWGNTYISGLITGSGGATLSGTLNINGASGGGSAANYVCTDSSGNIVVQSGAC